MEVGEAESPGGTVPHPPKDSYALSGAQEGAVGMSQPAGHAECGGGIASRVRWAAVNQEPAVLRWKRSGSSHDRNVRTLFWFEPRVHVHAHIGKRSNFAWFEPLGAWSAHAQIVRNPPSPARG